LRRHVGVAGEIPHKDGRRFSSNRYFPADTSDCRLTRVAVCSDDCATRDADGVGNRHRALLLRSSRRTKPERNALLLNGRIGRHALDELVGVGRRTQSHSNRRSATNRNPIGRSDGDIDLSADRGDVERGRRSDGVRALEGHSLSRSRKRGRQEQGRRKDSRRRVNAHEPVYAPQAPRLHQLARRRRQ
jgi:hypothetical protein